MSQGLSRRALLGGALGASAALPFLNRSRLRPAHAADPIPKRIVFFYTQQGTLRNQWAPTGTETDFSLGGLHAESLTPHQQDLIFLHGLDMRSDAVDPTGPANAHYAGTTHALTAIQRKSGTLPSGPSIDQFIASELNDASPLTKLRSLELAVRDVSFGEWAVSFDASGAPVPFETNPADAYERVFGDFSEPGMDAAAEARRAQDDLVLSWAAGEFDALSPQMSTLDKNKLEAHADLIRDLQNRLALQPARQTCEKPAMPTGGDYEQTYAGHLQVATAALACDLTRIVTLALPELPGELVGYNSGDHGTTDLHDLVHKTAENGELRDNSAAVQPIQSYHQLHAQQFAALLDQLRAIPESDGQTLLDHTVVLWCGQLGSGSHDLRWLPWILAGSGGGTFRTGRFIEFARPNDQGPAHNDLLVSLANYMGVPITSFGTPEVCRGPLSELA